LIPYYVFLHLFICDLEQAGPSSINVTVEGSISKRTSTKNGIAGMQPILNPFFPPPLPFFSPMTGQLFPSSVFPFMVIHSLVEF